MTAGLLLDTHVQLWLEHDVRLASTVRRLIADSSASNTLFASDISMWEFGVSQTKTNPERKPDLNGLSPAEWTDRFITRFGVISLRLSSTVIAEAALLPVRLRHKDPGDCHLIATAHLYNLALVTHDQTMIKLAAVNPEYLSVIPC